MNNKRKVLAVAMGAVLGVTGMSAQAAMLNAGDVLIINAGVPVYDTYGNPAGVSGGSWFALDFNSNGSITTTEKTAINPGGAGGLSIGGLQSVGAIDVWNHLNAPGYHYTTVAPTGGTTTGIDFSGWAIFWNGQPVNAIDAGVWAPNNCATLGCSGVSFAADIAAFNWSGVYGDSYSLWYSWSFYDSPGAFEPVNYLLHLEGTVQAAPEVPVPAAAWLLGSGLLGLMGVVRRKLV